MSYSTVDLFLIAVLYLHDRMWTMPEVKESDIIRTNRASVPNKELIAERYFSQMVISQHSFIVHQRVALTIKVTS